MDTPFWSSKGNDLFVFFGFGKTNIPSNTGKRFGHFTLMLLKPMEYTKVFDDSFSCHHLSPSGVKDCSFTAKE